MTKGELGAIVGAIVARLDAAAAAAADETHYGLAAASSLVEDLLQDPEFTMETVESFKARAEAHAGVRFESLPDVPPEALLEGQILCARDGCYVVTRGYPVEDPETGAQVYGAFGVVDRARLREPADVATPQIGGVVAMGGADHGRAVVVDHASDGTARLVYEREDGALLAGDAVRGWDRADEVEVALYRAAEPWNA